MKISKIILISLILCVYSNICLSQSNLSVAVTGLGFDFGDCENAAIYKIKANDNGKTILQPGLRFGGEVYATPSTSLKFAQTCKIDCMKKMAFSSQIMLRFRIFKIYKHSLSFGFGPTAFYRQTWEGFDGYIDEGIYKSGNFQNKVCWLSAELEYNYYISKKNDISFAITHLDPEAMGFAIGIKHWITRKSNKCGTCPSFK
ncbi:MAG: hypothetical protein MJ211_01915 [Bacteroidales bacterium]|nr:hypothetical protein [Bacteroidales bacterium]